MLKYLHLILLFVLLAGCNQTPEKRILLRLRLHPHDEYDIEIDNHVEMKMSRSSSSNSLKFSFTVDSVMNNNSVYLLSCKLGRAQMRTINRRERTSYDSDRKKKTNYIGYDYDPNNKMGNVEQVLEGIMDSTVVLHVNSRGIAQEPSMFKNDALLSLSGIPVSYNLFQITFPEKPVAINEEWTSEEKIDEAQFSRLANYRILSIKDSIIRIHVDGSLRGLGGSSNMPFGGEYGISEIDGRLQWANMQMKINTYFDGEGVYTISIVGH